jgi:hypothetical protein
MIDYEFSDLERHELHCEWCGKLISTSEFLENEGFCNNCNEYSDEEDWFYLSDVSMFSCTESRDWYIIEIKIDFSSNLLYNIFTIKEVQIHFPLF